MFLVLYITKSSARTGMAPRRDEIFFFLMGALRNSGLQLRPQRRSAPQLDGESFNCAQRGSTNVVLHSFHIVINDAVVEAKQPQKISEKFVSLRDLMCQALTSRSQNKATILFVFQQAFNVQSLD